MRIKKNGSEKPYFHILHLYDLHARNQSATTECPSQNGYNTVIADKPPSQASKAGSSQAVTRWDKFSKNG